MSNHYVDNSLFFQKICERKLVIKETEKQGLPKPKMSDYFGEVIIAIATNFALKPLYYNRTYKDEMINDAIENCCKYFDTFNKGVIANLYTKDDKSIIELEFDTTKFNDADILSFRFEPIAGKKISIESYNNGRFQENWIDNDCSVVGKFESISVLPVIDNKVTLSIKFDCDVTNESIKVYVFDDNHSMLFSNNPFSYFTQSCYYSFLNTIVKERDQCYVRQRISENINIDKIVTQEHDNKEVVKDYIEYLNGLKKTDYSKYYEEKERKKKVPNTNALEEFLLEQEVDESDLTILNEIL